MARIESRLDSVVDGQARILAAVADDARHTQGLELRVRDLEESVNAIRDPVVVARTKVKALESRVRDLEEAGPPPPDARRTATVGGIGALGGLTVGEVIHWLWSLIRGADPG